MARKLVVNGKFVAQGPTAVYRVSQELVTAIWARAPERELTLAVPPGCTTARNDPGVPLTPVGHMNGTAWEQISLPRHARGAALLNFCNMTPLVARNALTMVHDAQIFHQAASYHPVRRNWLQLHARVAGRVQPGLMTVSDFARHELADLGVAPVNRIHVVHNGVDHIEQVTPEDVVLDRLGVTSRGYALALSNLLKHKNIPVLLRAFARPEMADLKLVLVGQASREDFAAAGHPAPDNVIFPGYVTDGEMRSLAEQALAVCTPSLTEGFGMPPVEGMYLGTPAVVAPCGALPEVCGPSACYADPHDPEAWAITLLGLAADPDAYAKRAEACRAFAARYTWDAAAEKVLDLTDRLLP